MTKDAIKWWIRHHFQRRRLNAEYRKKEITYYVGLLRQKLRTRGK